MSVTTFDQMIAQTCTGKRELGERTVYVAYRQIL